MRIELQKYEAQTAKLNWLSLVVLVLGVVIYVFWSHLGGIVAAVGGCGLVWGFLRR